MCFALRYLKEVITKTVAKSFFILKKKKNAHTQQQKKESSLPYSSKKKKSIITIHLTLNAAIHWESNKIKCYI